MTAKLTENDPKSRQWRQAWKRYTSSWLDPVMDDEAAQLKIEHHLGWRQGVISVRNQHPQPHAPIYYQGESARAWNHGAIAGRIAAQAYVEDSGIDPRALR